ncbi:MAG: amino acid--tRNA ligase-related protein, partial [Myxococcota bacterium]|nr:amino acid--tRNA ligase-related protein [Myxococcota bacterium]
MALEPRTHTCGELRGEHVGQPVTLQGWVQAVRDKGGICFFVLRDRHGTVQLTVDETAPDSVWEPARQVRNEFVLQVRGEVRARAAGSENQNMATGGIELAVRELEILNRTRPLPFLIADDPGCHEETRLKFRYLDLRRPVLQRHLEVRHRTSLATRAYMDGQGFIEVETPILNRSTPEGARDYLVPSRVHPGQWYALPQSPQIFK